MGSSQSVLYSPPPSGALKTSVLKGFPAQRDRDKTYLPVAKA
jgi:hypothetical protein